MIEQRDTAPFYIASEEDLTTQARATQLPGQELQSSLNALPGPEQVEGSPSADANVGASEHQDVLGLATLDNAAANIPDLVGATHASAVGEPALGLPAGSLDNSDGIFLNMPEHANQSIEGNGNHTLFDLTQVNSLVSNGVVGSPSVSFNVDGSTSGSGLDGGIPDHVFSQTATAEGGSAAGGSASANDVMATLSGGTALSSGSASAGAPITQDAFTQSIVMGANVQFNSQEFNLGSHQSTDGSGIH